MSIHVAFYLNCFANASTGVPRVNHKKMSFNKDINKPHNESWFTSATHYNRKLLKGYLL